MANILFKRGVHNDLSKASVIDGAFYLTTDSHRLYAGIGSELVDLNKYIRTVQYAADLDKLTGLQSGDFAYIEEGNILAIYTTDGKGGLAWKQINRNTDTINASAAAAVSGSEDDVSLVMSVTDSTGKTVTTNAIKFTGTNGVDVQVDAANNTITIEGMAYTFSGKATTTSGKVTAYDLNLTPDDTEDTASKVTLVPGENIVFTDKGNNTLEIKAGIPATLAAADITVTGEDISMSVTDSSGKSVKDEQKNAIYMTYGETPVRASNQGHMSVYTIDEVNKKFNDLNGLTYKGVVDSLNTLKTKTTPQSGDIYMASAAFTFGTDAIVDNTVANDGKAEIGDLFIATGTEANGVITSNLKWIYVPSGNDTHTDTTYSATLDTVNHKLTLNASTGGTIATWDVDSGSTGKITLNSVNEETDNTKPPKWKLTLDHAAIAAGDKHYGDTDTKSGEDKVVSITSIDVDSTGHVKGYNTRTTSLKGFNLSGATVTTANNKATVVDTLKDTNGGAAGTSTFSLDASAADNLKITSSGTNIAIALEWGTFN
jgi:hypothetical protein